MTDSGGTCGYRSGHRNGTKSTTGVVFPRMVWGGHPPGSLQVTQAHGVFWLRPNAGRSPAGVRPESGKSPAGPPRQPLTGPNATRAAVL